MALAAIELSDVSVVLDGHVVLDKVNISVTDGESVVLIGPSGHGKSTLLKLMAGLIAPTEGFVRIRGENLAEISGARRQKLVTKIGMLFQKNALFDSLTCGENIAFPLREVTDDRGNRRSEVEIQRTCEDFLHAVGILEAKNLYPDELSGGMQKRLGIARALALRPDLVFYDDPTAGLDPITSRKIIDLILQLRRQNSSTIVTITNEMNRAYQMADRILMVADRQVIDAGSVEQTKKNSNPRVHQFINGEVTTTEVS